MTKPVVLLIGGLDPQGCAGITADIQTVTMHQCHPVPLVTCLTEQTSQGLTQLGALSEQQFIAQYQSAVADSEIAAIKIGLIPNTMIASCIVNIVQQHDVPVILDPVLATTSGGEGVDQQTQQLISEQLLPHVTIITPNLNELATLAETALSDFESWQQATSSLLDKGIAGCLVKGGHADHDLAIDYYRDQQHQFYCYQQKIDRQVRGTGCVLASSLACHLLLSGDVREAVVLAKIYLTHAFRHAEPVGPYYVCHHHPQNMALQDIPKLCYQAELIGQQFSYPSCPERLGIYPVVDSSDWVSKLVEEGVTTIQLRIKDVESETRDQQIQQALTSCGGDIAFFVNDHWQAAIEYDAYGVHLGQEDLHDAQLAEIAQAGLRLGVSTHSYWELARALAVNPSYIALGPVYETTSKQMPFMPQGIEKVAKWTQLLEGHYPLVAIGGIDAERAKTLKQTGVGSVAMISAITKAKNYQSATQDLLTLWQD